MAEELATGAALVERALSLNPNLSRAWLYAGWIALWQGAPEVAINRVQQALRLSPLDSLMYGMESAIAHAHFVARRHEEAAHWAEKALAGRPTFAPSLRVSAASHALLERHRNADNALTKLRAVDPDLRLSTLRLGLGSEPDQGVAAVT